VHPARARPASLCTAPLSLAAPCCTLPCLVSSPLSSDLTTQHHRRHPASHRIAITAHHATPNVPCASPPADESPITAAAAHRHRYRRARGGQTAKGLSIAIAPTRRHRRFNTRHCAFRLHLFFQAAAAQIAYIKTALRPLHRLCDRSSDSDNCAHCTAPPIAVQRNHQHGARRDRSRRWSRCARRRGHCDTDAHLTARVQDAPDRSPQAQPIHPWPQCTRPELGASGFLGTVQGVGAAGACGSRERANTHRKPQSETPADLRRQVHPKPRRSRPAGQLQSPAR
jgi:hypothetical protein